MAVREAHPQPLAFPTTAIAADHVRGGPGLINEDEALRIEIELAVEPLLALLQDVRTVLLDRVTSLFLRVIPTRMKNR
jgi:transposase